MANKTSGHPAMQDPDIAKLYKAMKASVELVRDLDGRLPSETMEYLKASTLGLMETYSKMTGKPSAIEIITTNQGDWKPNGLEHSAVS